MKIKKKILIGISSTSLSFIILFSFLGKISSLKKYDHQHFRSNFSEKKINGRQPLKKEKSSLALWKIILIFFLIVIAITVSFFIQRYRRHKYLYRRHKYFSGKCSIYCYQRGYVNIFFYPQGATPPDVYRIAEYFFIFDLRQSIKKNEEINKLYKELKEIGYDKTSFNQLIKQTSPFVVFIELINTFFSCIDGYLLQAAADTQDINGSTYLKELWKGFNEAIKTDGLKAIESNIFAISTDTNIVKKQLLKYEKEDSLALFKSIIKSSKKTYFLENIEYLLFEHYYMAYFLVRAIYLELTVFFANEKNKKYQKKYKSSIDEAKRNIDNFLNDK